MLNSDKCHRKQHRGGEKEFRNARVWWKSQAGSQDENLLRKVKRQI